MAPCLENSRRQSGSAWEARHHRETFDRLKAAGKSAWAGAGTAARSEMIREISCEQLLDKQLRFIESWFATPAPDKFVIFEIGTHDQFTERHLQRAIRLPPLPRSMDEVYQLIQDPVPEAIIYGQDDHDRLPLQWARLLEAAGFGEVYILRGGKQAWAQEGLTLQTGRVPADHFRSPLPEPERRVPEPGLSPVAEVAS